MDLETLRTFIDVARHGSFAPVARQKALDPSSVSRSVAALEAELGVRLFQRSTRRLTLTEAGSLYLERTGALVDQIDAARDDALAISAGPAGTLRLSTSVSFGCACLVPLLPDFRREYPGIRLELLLDDRNLDLVADRVDLAVRLGPVIDANVVATRLFEMHYRVCAAPAYLAAAPRLESPEDLSSHRCLRMPLPGFRSRWLFRRGREKVREVGVDGDLIVSSALALREAAIAGLGPALLPHWLIAAELARGSLVDCFPDFRVRTTNEESSAWIIYPSRVFLPRKVRVTIDFLRHRLAPLAIGTDELARIVAASAAPARRSRR